MRRFCLLCLLLCLCAAVGHADTLYLPEGLLAIEAETFEGDVSLDEVIVPEGTLTIGSRAFADSGVTAITLPESLTEIADDAFSGCLQVWVTAPAGSYAAEYVRAHEELMLAGTTYRALLVGQLYSGTSSALKGSARDVNSMAAMLRTMDATHYSAITAVTDLTASGILSSLTSAFADADEDDVSLFYYSGHGLEGGWLVGTDDSCVTPAMLRNTLDAIPGKKIILVDACYSGGMIAKSASLLSAANAADDPAEETAVYSQAEVSAFVDDFLSAFSMRARSAGLLDESPYYVITACTGDQLSWERHTNVSGTAVYYGIFTYSMLLGCGYNEMYGTVLSGLNADKDGSGLLTLSETYAYAYAMVNTLVTTTTQTVCVYPTGSAQVLFGRSTAE